MQGTQSHGQSGYLVVELVELSRRHEMVGFVLFSLFNSAGDVSGLHHPGVIETVLG